MKSMSFFPLFCAMTILSASAALSEGTDIGAALFADNCATCHGADAKGGGDMADVLTIKATNLTLLAKGNDGEFPMLKVIQSIDGRTGTRAHGGPMPIWGSVFSNQGAALGYGSETEARGRMLSLALYLESIQAQ